MPRATSKPPKKNRYYTIWWEDPSRRVRKFGHKVQWDGKNWRVDAGEGAQAYLFASVVRWKEVR